MRNQRLNRIECALLLVLICILVALVLWDPGGQRAHTRAREQVFANQFHTISILGSILASDTRFREIETMGSTSGSVSLHGSVASRNDLDDLRRAVEKAQLPTQPRISVEVEVNLHLIPTNAMNPVVPHLQRE